MHKYKEDHYRNKNTYLSNPKKEKPVFICG